jgi:predicted transcriptional regulator
MHPIRTEREPLRAQLVVRLSDAERAQLEQLAVERDRSLSYLVRDGVKLLLARESDREAMAA